MLMTAALSRRLAKLARRDVAPLIVCQWVLRQLPFAPIRIAVLHFLLFEGLPVVSAAHLRGPGYVRAATAQDLDAMPACGDKRAVFKARFAAGDDCVVADIDGRIVGYEWFCHQPSHVEATHGYRIHVPRGSVYAYDAYLDPQYRNSGFWLRFKAHLAALMTARDARDVLTFVEEGNTASRNAHVRFGFKPVKSVLALRVFGVTLFKESVLR
jgi:GNAT superfamily N-acetyltransferase